MAFLLQFPPSTLPDNIREPPYVIFGINGTSVREKLPKRIPLNAVLHFVPKLAQYVLPEPQDLPPELALEAPHVGIDIHLDVTVGSFHRVILKVLEAAGMFVPQERLQLAPTTIASVAIRKTWLLLELPPAGLDAILIHLQTQLMTGPPVRLNEMKMLWNGFPADSMMIRLMAVNYMQSYVANHYPSSEFKAMRMWSLDDPERWNVFEAAEKLYPEFGKKLWSLPSSQYLVNDDTVEDKAKAMEMEQKEADEAAAQEVLSKKKKGKEKKISKQKLKKAMSMEELEPNATMHKSMKWTPASGGKDGADTVDNMATKLTDALQKVQLEREAESAADDEAAKETLQPTVYDASASSSK
jgi:hypothetical protein